MNATGRARCWATAAATAALALLGCSHRATYPLPAAGQMNDDGVDDGAGQLARASVQLQLGADDPDYGLVRAEAARDGGEYWRRGRSPGPKSLFAGSVYGLDASFGNDRYGGFAFGGGARFGIVGPPLTPREAGDASLVGVVSWRSDGGVAWPPGCPGARVAQRGAATAGALVYLALDPGSEGSDDDERWSVSRGAIAADGCALWPAVQGLGPVPGIIDLENGGPTSLRLTAGAGRSELTLDPGARWTFPMTEPTLVRLDARDRAPAWVVGLAHGYHTTTDSLGRFALDGVPAGTFELAVWYPPMVRGLADGRPVWTEPTVTRQRVTVGVRATARVVIALDPAR